MARKVIRAPRNKAAGADEVFVEALIVDQETMRKLICTLCGKSGRFKQLIKNRSTAILIPLYKNEVK